MQLRSLSSYVCLVAADVTALVCLQPQPGALMRGLSAPHAWIQSAGADTAAATLAGSVLWLVAAWLAAGLAAALLAAVPGAFGRRAAHLTRALLPDVVYRLAVGATGAGLVLAPAGVGTALATGGVACAAAAASSTTAALPTPAWPTSAPSSVAPSEPAPAPTPTPPPKTAPGTSVVTVRAGDSLWTIAATRWGQASDAAITARWRAIYRANRVVIGPDPGLIRPGQQLHVDDAARP